jgi:hypothetical protein
MSNNIFKPSDFAKMRWNAYRAKDEESLGLSRDVPAARRIMSNKMQVQKYFCFMYDVNSPLNRRIQNVIERREMAAQMAGFDRTNASVITALHQLFKLSLPIHQEVLLGMLRIQHNRTFDRIIAEENLFYQCVEIINTPLEFGEEVDPEKTIKALNAKQVTRKIMAETDEMLIALRAKIFFDEDEYANAVVEKMISWSPEGVSE